MLQRHLPEGTVVVGFGGSLDTALRRNRHVSPDYDVQAARLCEAATERLSKQLRALSDVALRVGTGSCCCIMRLLPYYSGWLAGWAVCLPSQCHLGAARLAGALLWLRRPPWSFVLNPFLGSLF